MYFQKPGLNIDDLCSFFAEFFHEGEYDRGIFFVPGSIYTNLLLAGENTRFSKIKLLPIVLMAYKKVSNITLTTLSIMIIIMAINHKEIGACAADYGTKNTTTPKRS